MLGPSSFWDSERMNRTATELAILLTLSCGSSVLHAAGQASTATTAALSPVQLSKADPVVVQTARAGQTQRVLVRIDAHDISERLEKVQQTRGDEAFVSETVREMDALKGAIFPGGRLGRVPKGRRSAERRTRSAASP